MTQAAPLNVCREGMPASKRSWNTWVNTNWANYHTSDTASNTHTHTHRDMDRTVRVRLGQGKGKELQLHKYSPSPLEATSVAMRIGALPPLNSDDVIRWKVKGTRSYYPPLLTLKDNLPPQSKVIKLCSNLSAPTLVQVGLCRHGYI